MDKDIEKQEGLQESVSEPESVPETVDKEDVEMLPKSTVSKIVARERQKEHDKAYKKGREEALMELQNQEAQVPVDGEQQQQQVMPPQNLGGMQQLSQSDIERMIMEKAPQALQGEIDRRQQQQMVDSFVSKMQAAEQKYPGLEQKLNELDYSSLNNLVPMANDMDNTGDIMNELVNNPEKMSNLILLSYTQPALARRKMADLSNSIKQNEAALAEEKEAKNPMSQLKPSTSAGMDSSAMSVKDFRKIFR